jgi:transcriptional regulator with XRE-family HTH domain
MSALLTPDEIEARAKDAGLSLVELCDRAGIALSTFYRWRAGVTEPRLDVYRRLEAASEPAKIAA